MRDANSKLGQKDRQLMKKIIYLNHSESFFSFFHFSFPSIVETVAVLEWLSC